MPRRAPGGVRPIDPDPIHQSKLVQQVMSTEPYASAKRVFWIVDNGSSHRGQAAVTRMSQAWPTATLVHTPIHASLISACLRLFVCFRHHDTPHESSRNFEVLTRVLVDYKVS